MPNTTSALLTGWGLTAATRAQVARVLGPADARAALASTGSRGAIARGLGRSYGDPAQNAGGTVLDLTGLDAITLDQATGLLTASGGASLDSIMRRCAPCGWWVPVTPGTRQVTIGGAIAADVHGKNHHIDGTFSAHVRSLTLLLPDGSTVECTPGEDLFHATAGGMGLTGVILQAQMQLLPISTTRARVDTDRVADLDVLMSMMAEGDAEYRYSVAWIDAGTSGALGRGVLTRGDHATAEDAPGAGLDFDPPARLSVPPVIPPGVLNRWSISAFNEAWYRKAPRQRRGELQHLAAFFHPLDGVRDWNRMYGRAGFLQYQFVVPDSAGELVPRTLEALRAIGATSFLSVLKRFGAEGPGLLSFPRPGWTLALDIPTGVDGLAAVLDRLDEHVLGAGGRLYLAKDSRMSPAMLAGYPRLAEFRAVRDRVDPDRRLASDLSRRLSL